MNDREKTEEIIAGMRRFLSTRERAKSEVKHYLIKKGVRDTQLVEEVIRRLVESDLLNEFRFAQNRLESRLGRGYGPVYIQNELRSLSIDSTIVSELIDGIDAERIVECACEIVEKKLPALIRDEQGAERLRAMLLRRGFSANHANHAIRIVRERYPHWGRRIS